ncbi:hypothetical protein [Variovorax rhizosphaerae]|uniref:Uncharacterized protein n=1 Tax=Variovorax rhizosphaerae TaxID=1836200 RepID=A0ABU8WWW6_9BURK
MTARRSQKYIALLILLSGLLTLPVFANEPVRPPNDDSDRSTVRVNTYWATHALGKAACLQRAKETLTKLEYFVDITEKSVFGLKEGLTASIRCDYKGLAFFVMAFRTRPDAPTQQKLLADVTTEFSKKRNGGKQRKMLNG